MFVSAAPIRIIASLDIKGENVVKGVRLEGLRIVGKPDEFAWCYYPDGADEILFVDIVDVLEGEVRRLPDLPLASKGIALDRVLA